LVSIGEGVETIVPSLPITGLLFDVQVTVHHDTFL